MTRSFFRLTGCAMVVSAVSACTQLPPDYSSNFVRVPVVTPDHPGRVRYALVPEACLTPDPTDNTGPFGSQPFGPHLPPGCANNANLLAMVEKKSDVVHGRKLGRAPAAPSARAAQRYIYGTRGQLGAGILAPGPALTPATVTTEPVPPPATH